MTGRISNLLLVALFAVAHIFVQPLATTGHCMGAVEMGGQCCCSLPEAAPASCCGSDAPSDGEPADSEEYSSGCHCKVSPPAPALPEPTPSSVTEQGEGAEEFATEFSELHAGVWPSVGNRAARPPNPPPRVASRTTPAFTQVYRL